MIGAPTITANSDTFTVTNGANGGYAGNVLTNDEYNGTTNLVGNASVTLTWLTVPTGIQTHTNGDLTVAAGTASGTYAVTYKLCENLNGSNCSIATATIVVGQATITAKNNNYAIANGAVGGTTSNVLENDIYNGITNLVGNTSITLTWNTVPASIQTNANGTISVPAGTPSGVYTLTYTICENLNNYNCSTATVTVAVGVSLIVAEDDNDDTFKIPNGANGGTTSSVLANDTLNGVTPPNTTSITLTWTNVPTGIQTHTDGTISVPAGTPAGTYTISYRICERLNGSNCSSATVTVVVGQATLTAVDNTFTVTNTTTTTTDSVLNNDSYNGTTGLVGNASVTLTWLNVPAGIQTNTNGSLTIPAGTASGTYAVTYRLCENLNNSNCSIATATIVVKGIATPTVTPTIEVTGDSYTHTVSGTTYTTTSNVLTNDKVGGVTATIASVTIHTSTPTTDKPYIDAQTGLVVIPSGTPTGTHTITYYICDKVNTSLCSSPTVVTITVVGSVTTPTAVTIEANGDEFNYYAVATQTTLVGNVLTNDKLNGALNPSVRSVTITTPAVSNPRAPYIHPATGDVTVPPHTPAGVYELPYTICALASPTECSTATAVVRISTIEAHNDGQHQLGTTAGGTISSVLTNDKLNGQRPAAGEVNINWIPSSLSGFTFNNDGTIDVAAGTPVGTYTIGYTLCATATPTLCSERAEVVVAVTAAVPVPPFSIMAVYDGPHYIDQGTATTVASVLANDTLDADPATTGNVSLTWNISSPAGITLNADGTVAVASSTAAGVYKVPYTICAKNGTLCATTDIEIVVIAPTVTPTIEVNGETFTYTGSPVVGNVLTNEKLNGVPNPSVRSVTISIMPPLPGVNEPYLNPETGDVIVPPATVAGTYTVTYRVCTIAAPVSCDTASVRVVVPASVSTPTAAPVAADDRATTIRNTPVTIAVLSNDTPNGATLPNITTTPLNGTAIVNADGSIEYRPSTNFVGTDRIVYELCDAFGQCASAVVTIEVTNGLLPYNGISIDGNERNSYFHIGGIEAYPKNVVKIFNRWGVQVFEIEHYDNVRNVFRGLSNGRVTIERGSKLPQGTYYYIIEYEDDNHQQQKETGWLYLKRN